MSIILRKGTHGQERVKQGIALIVFGVAAMFSIGFLGLLLPPPARWIAIGLLAVSVAPGLFGAMIAVEGAEEIQEAPKI